MKCDNKMMEGLTDELMSTVHTIHGLLALAQYYQNRTEMNTYLALISACILKVEKSVEKTQGIQLVKSNDKQ